MPALLNPTKTKILSASTLAGYRVRSTENEDWGTIEELMIDGSDGNIAFAVLSLGCFPGLADKLLAVPWDLLTLNAHERVLVLKTDRETIQSAPAFEQDDWPDFTDHAWGAAIKNHFATKQYSYYED
ncbi:MAG TPA: PRC-barrel domain-containing protein [Bryobacteraceae bacterium]|nr:PRC-barrel domain-containing protein [Bryobacteraceae bacterium]